MPQLTNKSTDVLRDTVRAISLNRIGGSPDVITVGMVMRERRTELGLLQSDVAKLIHIKSPVFIGMIENGLRKLDLNKIPSLARALKLDEEDLTKLALHNLHPEAYAALYHSATGPSKIKNQPEETSNIREITREDLELLQIIARLDSTTRAALRTLAKAVTSRGSANSPYASGGRQKP